MSIEHNDWFYSSEAFQAFFKSSSRSLVIKANPPLFTILAVSDHYLRLTHRQQSDLLQQSLFEIFPGNAADQSQKDSLLYSLLQVIDRRQTDVLPVYQYEIFLPDTGETITQYWSNINEPVLDREGNVAYIVRTVSNITERLATEKTLTEANELKESLQREQLLNEELAANNEEIKAINEELHGSRENLYALNKELEARVAARTKLLVESEASLKQMNEELAATNEELAAINEEQAAINEELLTMQQQLQRETAAKQKAIDRLEANEKNIRNMVRQAPVGMCIVQGDPLYVVETNDAFLEIIGKQREQFYSTPYWEVNAEARAYYEPITTNVLATGTTYRADEHEIMLIRRGKPEIVHVDFVYEPMKDEEGKPYAIIIVAIEVTEKVLSRRKIEQAEESLRMAIDAAELGSYYINTEDRLFVPSPRLKEFFGFEPDEEVPYEAAINQIHPDYRQAAADLVEAAITRGVRFDMEYPVVGHKDGKIRWVRGIGTVQQGSNGQRFFTGVVNEITEKKQDEIRKNDFIGMVSHELKTPLTSMSGYLQMLQLNAGKSEDQFTRSLAEKANKQVSKMTTLINGFLNVSRLEAGKIHINKQRFDMAELLKEAAEESFSMYNTHRIVFAPVEPIYVNADYDKIGQVINNLISNAVKYSAAGATINVACIAIEGIAQVSIKDEGIGINTEDRDRLFERYYRVSNSNTISVAGFGIGLYLCAEIVQRHNGKIWVESEVGSGSTFYFNLPVEPV